MFIAGITEFFLIACVLFSASLFPRQAGKTLQLAYVMTLGFIALSAFMGALRFLELANTLTFHTWFTYLSRHLAMTCFVIFSLWPNLQSSRAKLLAKMLLLLSLISCMLNLNFQLTWLTDVTIFSALLFTVYQLRRNTAAMLSVVVGLVLLASNPLWGLIIDNESLRIGINHFCLGAYFILLGKSFSSNFAHGQMAN